MSTDLETKEALRKAMLEAVWSEAAKLKPKDIMDHLLALGLKQRQDIVKGLMGMDYHWGEIQFYKTNAYVGDMQKWVWEAIGNDVKQFVQETARAAWEDKKEGLRKDIKIAIDREVGQNRDRYDIYSTVRDLVKHGVQDEAKKQLDTIAAELFPKDGT